MLECSVFSFFLCQISLIHGNSNVHPLAILLVAAVALFLGSTSLHPRPLRACAEPQATVIPPRRSPLAYGKSHVVPCSSAVNGCHLVAAVFCSTAFGYKKTSSVPRFETTDNERAHGRIDGFAWHYTSSVTTPTARALELAAVHALPGCRRSRQAPVSYTHLTLPTIYSV